MQRHPYAIRPLKPEELDEALALVLRTFLEFEAPDYPPEGVENFRHFIGNPETQERFRSGKAAMWVALDGGRIIGVAAMRGETHLCLLFVDQKYHRRGVGRALIQTVTDSLQKEGHTALTVNAAPYGAPFYRKVGFADTAPEQIDDGIRFTPMRCDFSDVEIP